MKYQNNYRPEIDGLRAIAVVAVILYHAQIILTGDQLFKGGFIGVDIFFVISGYLITSIILKELITTGSFSFKYFYERRIRRILPVLIFVMLVSLPFAWLYLLPNSFVDFSKSILYSLGFSSNFYFHYSGQVYEAQDSLLKPFLHTWSLSVEEQFYIIFPVLLLVAYKYFKKRLGIILIAGCILSLLIAEWGSRNHPSFNFYILPTRGWELLAGSILAYFEIQFGHRSKNKILNLILPSIGLLLIGHSILFFNDQMFHPSFYTLSPIIGVSLIIWYSNKDELITKILSSKLFVGIGLISYSLYLWHYPIFAFARISEDFSGDIFKKLLLVVVAIVLSIISYFLVEKKARNKIYDFKFIISGILVSVTLLVLFSSFMIYKDGRLNKINALLEGQLSSPLFKSKCKYSTTSVNFVKDSFFKNDFDYCNSKHKKFILILGDSHSIDLFNLVAKITNDKEYIIGLNKGGCRPPGNKSKCHYLNAYEFIKKNKDKIKYILFNHKGSYFLTNSGDASKFKSSYYRKLPINKLQVNNTYEYLKNIKKEVKNLIFIGPHLEPNIELSRYNLIKIFNNISAVSKFDNTNKDLIIVDNELKKISKINNIDYISKIDSIKFNFNEDFIVNSRITFSDTDHWNDFGEIYFGKRLIENSQLKYILSY